MNLSNSFSLNERVKSWINGLRHGQCCGHSFGFLQSRMLHTCRTLWGETPRGVPINILVPLSQSAFPWQNSWYVLTVAHECVHHSPLPVPSACPSLPPFVTHIPWLFLTSFGKDKEISTTGMTDPESVFSFPKDLGFLAICFRSFFCWMQMFSFGSFKQFSSPLWASAVLQVNEFSIPREFGTCY